MENNNLPYNIARVISTLFVPPTFTILLFTCLAFLIETDVSNQIFIIFNSLIFGLILPVIVFFRMRKENKISDIDTSIKEERNAPYLLNALFCAAAVPQLLILNTDIIFTIIWMIFLINTLILYTINRFWKISAHLISAGITLGALEFILGSVSYFLIILMITIGWARIELKIHNVKQVFAGGVLGFSLTYILLNVIYKIVSII